MHDLNPTLSGCVSELELDEWIAGELSPSDRERCEQHVRECSACQARKQAIEQANAAYLAEAPDFRALQKLAGAPKANVRHLPRKRSQLRWLTAPLLAACAALAFVAVRPSERPSVSAVTRSKGGPRLGYFVKRGENVQRGQSSGVVHPGDALRFVYSADQAYFLAIFSADAHGVGVYFPSGPKAERVAAGQEIALDFSVALDDTLGRERVTALFCTETFQIEPVQSALSSGGTLPAALASCQTAGFELNKQAGQ